MNVAAKTLSLRLAVLVCLIFTNGLAHADDIYVTYWREGGDSGVEKFDSSGHGEVFLTGIDDPAGLAFDSGGNLYVANKNQRRVEKYDSSGNFLSQQHTASNPVDLAFDSSGNLYVAESYPTPLIQKSGSGTNFTIFASFILANGGGLAVDSTGNLYATSYGGASIMKFDSSGNASVFAEASSLGEGEFGGLAFDSSGNLYVSDTQYGILRFDPSGQVSLFAGGLYGEQSLAFDSTGNLYATSHADRCIMKFDSSGQGAVFATVSGLVDIAVQVPEPATWSLLVLGAVALLGGLRLRRRSS